jgi:single-stranded-DNA-specific exonuclease
VELRRRKVFDAQNQPRLDRLLDLVALGTVADVVRLDGNNRLLVAQGLKRIREGRMQAGVAALFHVAGRDPRNARTSDLGFAVGPRINAAGRLADMSLGIACLITDDRQEALQLAERLSAINQERRTIEATMQTAALDALSRLGDAALVSAKAAICVSDPTWHQGVVGILAGRLKERFNRPTVAFAPIADGRWRGSGRSIEGVHLRDVLDLVAKRDPQLILQFGGHAMAAGLTITDRALAAFPAALERAVRQFLNPAAMQRVVEVDGSLAGERINVPLVNQLENGIWGQGFAAPQFCDWFSVVSQRVLKDKHTKLALRMAPGGAQFDAIWFNQVATLPAKAKLVYRLATDEYNGATRIQLLITHHIEEASAEPV